MPEVILRDLDGTETIAPHDSPLPLVIAAERDAGGIGMIRSYVRSQDRDGEGRPIYVETRL